MTSNADGTGRGRGYDRTMPNIRLIEPDDADGVLKEEYDAAHRSALRERGAQ